MRITDLTMLTMDPPGTIIRGDLRIEGDRIEGVGRLDPRPGEETMDGAWFTAVPGFVQVHVHFCQTLFRGLAEDLPLMRWLRERIWPLEAAHDAASTRASARLSVLELVSGGTTAVQVMESVRHAEESFEVARETGITAVIGNCLMDAPDPHVPPALIEPIGPALERSVALAERYDGQDARLFYALSPRFILACTDELLREVARLSEARTLRIHTHAAEHQAEMALVRARTGRGNIEALHALGLLGRRTGLAHCVHVADGERHLLRESGAAVLHCPSTNLKLGSGIAPITDYLARGIRVGLGADGAPANNRLCALTEMRQASLLQKAVAGPEAMGAWEALELATIGGARAIGLERSIGSITPGKRADIVLFRLDAPHMEPAGDAATRIVHAARPTDIEAVIVGGRFAVVKGRSLFLDEKDVIPKARMAIRGLLAKTGLSR